MKGFVFLIAIVLFGISCDTPEQNNYAFDGKISQEVLENYLDKAITMSELLTVDPFCNDGTYPDKQADLAFIHKAGAKFIGRSIYRWGDESVLNNPKFWTGAKSLIDQVHALDADVIFQAAAFEAVSTEVNDIKIPAWVFDALSLPVENRNFDYARMLNGEGKLVDLWGKGVSVPDITQEETQLWFMYLIGSYVNIGIEAVHLGQVALIGINDPDWKSWRSFMAKIRGYANQRARRHMMLFDAHTPAGGMVIDGISLLDFNSFPLRIKELEGKPMQCILETGHLDALFNRSLGCTTPSGWHCETLPYLVEFDNFGISDHPGVANVKDHYVWGYDEISWFYLQSPADKDQWLRYAYHWIKHNAPHCHLEMPGARVVSLDHNSPAFLARAVASSQTVRYGMGIEKTVIELWQE